MNADDTWRWTRIVDGHTTTILGHVEDDGTFHVEPEALDTVLRDAGWTRA